MTESHDPSQPHDVGSAAEEAAKLFGALGEWAKQHSGDVANNLAVGLTAGLAGLAGHAQAAAAEANHSLEEHLATGAPECTYCPICRTVHVVRAASPEVLAHLTSAAASLLQAASAILAAAGTPNQGSRRESSVERIDLDMDQSWPDAGSAPWPDHGHGEHEENQQ